MNKITIHDNEPQAGYFMLVAPLPKASPRNKRQMMLTPSTKEKIQYGGTYWTACVIVVPSTEYTPTKSAPTIEVDSSDGGWMKIVGEKPKPHQNQLITSASMNTLKLFGKQWRVKVMFFPDLGEVNVKTLTR